MLKFLLHISLIFSLFSLTAHAERLTLILDWYMNPHHAPLYAAEKYGIFKKHNLAVKIISPSEGQTGPKMVALSKADMAVSYQYHFHLFQKQGLPLKRIATLIPSPLNCLIVKADGGIKTPQDLKGKKIGYHVGLGTSQKFIQTMLNTVGLTLADVTLIHAKNSLTASFLTGQLDAITGGFRTCEPAKMKAQNIKILSFNYEDYGVPSYEELIILGHKDAKTQTAFLIALKEAVVYCQHNTEKVLADFIKDHPEQDPKMTAETWAATIPLFTTEPEKERPEMYKEFEKYLG